MKRVTRLKIFVSFFKLGIVYRARLWLNAKVPVCGQRACLNCLREKERSNCQRFCALRSEFSWKIQERANLSSLTVGVLSGGIYDVFDLRVTIS